MDITTLAYLDSTGYHFADYPSFLSWLQDTYRGIYGADVYIEPNTQDGQFLAVLAKAFYDTAALGGSIYNSFSPVTAQGVGLSRNVKINGLSRISATHSTVDLQLVGVVGTIITDGVAEDTLSQKWDLPSPTTIPSGGTITVTATAQVEGATQAQANTVNRIFTPTQGWQSVNNPAQATAGVPIETDAELRVRQTRSTANPSLTVLEGTVGGVANLAGVTDVRAYENDTDTTDGNGLPAHSIALIVKGGSTSDIVQEIALHKTPGTRTDGTTSQVVYDQHGMPLTIRFSRPTEVTITVTITLTVDATYSSDYSDLIKQSVADYINSIGIGNNVLISKMFSPAYLNNTTPSLSYDIADLEIGKNLDPQGTINIPIAFDEQPACDPDTDVVVIVT